MVVVDTPRPTLRLTVAARRISAKTSAATTSNVPSLTSARGQCGASRPGPRRSGEISSESCAPPVAHTSGISPASGSPVGRFAPNPAISARRFGRQTHPESRYYGETRSLWSGRRKPRDGHGKTDCGQSRDGNPDCGQSRHGMYTSPSQPAPSRETTSYFPAIFRPGVRSNESITACATLDFPTAAPFRYYEKVIRYFYGKIGGLATDFLMTRDQSKRPSGSGGKRTVPIKKIPTRALIGWTGWG